MNPFSKLKIGARLFLGFTLVLILTITIGAYGADSRGRRNTWTGRLR